MAGHRPLSTRSFLVVLAAVAATLAACSGKSGTTHASSTQATTAASPTSVSSAAAADTSTDAGTGSAISTSAAGGAPGRKVSDVRMRVVNLYSPIGASGPPAAGPALDIYDVQLTGQAATPVTTNVAYGSASPYFAVHEPANSIGNPPIELYALPAGEDPTTKQADSKGVGGINDDGSHAQVTFVLVADNSGLALGGPLGRLSFSDRVEKGDDGNGSKAPVAPAPAAGQAEILVDTLAVPAKGVGLYLRIGNSCAPPINGDPLAKGLPEIFNGTYMGISTSFAIFTTTPGTHQVSVVEDSSSIQPTCAHLTARQGTVSVDVAAGQQVEAYVYGTSDTDLHLALAPLQQ